MYAITEPLDNPRGAEIYVLEDLPSLANTNAYDDNPPQIGGDVTISSADNQDDIMEIPPQHSGTPSTILTTLNYAPNIKLTVDVCDSISQRSSKPPQEQSPTTVVVTSLQTVSEHCYSNNAVVNPSAERKRDVEIRNHNRVHQDSMHLMPLPAPPPPPVSRTILNMPDGDYLTYTHTGFELANTDVRTLPHSNAASIKLLCRVTIENCKQMSVNIGDKKIHFTAIRVPLEIYCELPNTNMFLMVCKGQYYMCCTLPFSLIYVLFQTQSCIQFQMFNSKRYNMFVLIS